MDRDDEFLHPEGMEPCNRAASPCLQRWIPLDEGEGFLCLEAMDPQTQS